MFRAQPSLGTQISFKEMYDQLEREEGGKGMARPLVYRYLKSLEEDGLIVVDRSAYRNTYSVGLETLALAFEELRKDALESMQRRLDEIVQQQEAIQSSSVTDITLDLVESLVGRLEDPAPRTVSGFEGIQRLIDTEIYTKAREGDIIRATVDWVVLDPDVERQRQEGARRLLERGIEWRSLIRQPWAHNETIGAMRKEFYEEVKGKHNVSFRFIGKKEYGYQLIGKNREGIVLIVSEDPTTAIWIPRTTNSVIVDDALNSFDAEFEVAVDMMEVDEGGDK
jgi:DNA-binding transcriptional ArsR family regulator